MGKICLEKIRDQAVLIRPEDQRRRDLISFFLSLLLHFSGSDWRFPFPFFIPLPIFVDYLKAVKLGQMLSDGLGSSSNSSSTLHFKALNHFFHFCQVRVRRRRWLCPFSSLPLSLLSALDRTFSAAAALGPLFACNHYRRLLKCNSSSPFALFFPLSIFFQQRHTH